MSRQQDNEALIREKGELPLWRGWRQAPAKHKVTLGHDHTEATATEPDSGAATRARPGRKKK
jgi:hypothetical protein